MTSEHFPKARVPNHLAKLKVKSIPLETAFYILPGEETPFDPADVFITSDNSLGVRLSAEVDHFDIQPTSPIGRVGIMRVCIVDGGMLTEGLVADLRFVGDSELEQDTGEAPDDQEDFNDWAAFKADTKEIDAFIATEPDAEVGDDGVIEGKYYGPEAYHGVLDTLRKRGDGLLQAWQRQEKAKQNKKATAATSGNSSGGNTKKEKVKKTTPEQ